LGIRSGKGNGTRIRIKILFINKNIRKFVFFIRTKMKTKHEIIDFLKSELNIAIIKPYLPLHILEDYKNNHPKKTRQRLYS